MRCASRRSLGGARPVDRGTEVGPQLVEAGDALDLGGPGEELMDVGDLVEAPLRMARRDHVGGAGLREVLGAELAHRFEQPEATAERAGLDDQHRPVDQVAEKVVDVVDVHEIEIDEIQICAATIAAAATRSNVPAKIDRHRNIACCGGVSRS